MQISIQTNIEEQALMEILLNMKYSGTNKNHLMIILGMHALAKSWKVDKMIYYVNLLGED